jgi:hypothetical protein
MNEKDLETALDDFADALNTLIAYFTAHGQQQTVTQCVQLQAGLRSAASVIGASNLVQQFDNDAEALQELTDATNILNNNANKIAQQQKNVSIVVGVVNAASVIVGALAPFNLAKAVQGLVDLKGAATI